MRRLKIFIHWGECCCVKKLRTQSRIKKCVWVCVNDAVILMSRLKMWCGAMHIRRMCVCAHVTMRMLLRLWWWVFMNIKASKIFNADRSFLSVLYFVLAPSMRDLCIWKYVSLSILCSLMSGVLTFLELDFWACPYLSLRCVWSLLSVWDSQEYSKRSCSNVTSRHGIEMH